MSTALTIPEPSLGDLIPHNTALEMARTFNEVMNALEMYQHRIEEQTERLNQILKPSEHSNFNLSLHFVCRNYTAEHFDRLRKQMEQNAWERLIDQLGLKNIMSVAKRQKFEKQIKDGDLPPINEETIVGILSSLCEQAQDFAKEAAVEVFDLLRPNGPVSREYKTNDGFRVGRKVILTWHVERAYGLSKFRTNYNREQQLTAIDGVFHLLDGKGIMREHRGPLVSAINSSPDGKGETAYFKFKCFKNGNLHLEMRREDLVRQLNLLAVGDNILGKDTDQKRPGRKYKAS